MVMDELQYFRTKAKALELQMEEQQLLTALENVRSRRLALLSEVGLTADGPYRFNDKDFTIEKVNG